MPWLAFLPLLAMVAVSPSSSAAATSPFTDEFAVFIQQTLEQQKLPGVALGVVDGDDVFTQAYGYATLPNVSATTETLWYGGSTTKAQTAAVISQLIDNKTYPALSKGWSTPISSIIHDDFVMQDDWATNHLTLDDAISHRTGLGRHDRSFIHHMTGGRNSTPKDIVRNIRNIKATAEPRTTVIYCNHMLSVLTHVIQTLTGDKLTNTFQKLIWGPLGMNSTYLGLQDALGSKLDLAQGYYWDEQTKTHKTMPFMPLDDISGAGAVISTVTDYTKWIKCLLTEAAPFSKAVHEDIRTPRSIFVAQASPERDVQLYGLGWYRTLVYGKVLYTHDGTTLSTTASIYWLPELNYGVVAFTNILNPALRVLLVRLVEDKLGIPADERFNLTDALQQASEKNVQQIANSTDRLYPDRPKIPAPSSVNTSALAGSYRDAGYGTMKVREEAHPSRAEESVLVIDRPDATFAYRVIFHHVSGNFWVAYFSELDGSPAQPYASGRAEFTIGENGKPNTLVLNIDDGPVTFQRVD